MSKKQKTDMIESIIASLANGLDEAYEEQTSHCETKKEKAEFDNEWVILAVEALVGQINEMLTASDLDDPEVRKIVARELSKIRTPK